MRSFFGWWLMSWSEHKRVGDYKIIQVSRIQSQTILYGSLSSTLSLVKRECFPPRNVIWQFQIRVLEIISGVSLGLHNSVSFCLDHHFLLILYICFFSDNNSQSLYMHSSLLSLSRHSMCVWRCLLQFTNKLARVLYNS